MFVSFASNHLALVAIVAGVISASLNTGIEDLLDKLIDQETLKIRETSGKCLLAGFTVGWLLGIIYYAFAIYGSAESSMTPIQVITLFALYFGSINPLLGIILKLLFRRVFT